MLSMSFFSKVLVVEETIEGTVTMCISMLIKDVQISVPVFQGLEGCTQFVTQMQRA